MDDEISIQLFCHSLDSWLRLLLRSVKVLLEFGLSGHAARDCRLGWFRDGSDGAIFLLRVFWGLGMLKRPETIVVWRHWFGRSLRPGKPSNSPRGAEGATMARRVPFPPSSIPAYIEQSMKLFVCLRSRWCTAKSVPGRTLVGKIVDKEDQLTDTDQEEEVH
jgi:hypothetical protein